jgi:eukaryotic translation initiation factor 2C
MLDRSGADITHLPLGNCRRPSLTSLVGTIDANAVQLASRMSAQSSQREVIEDLENMCVVRAYHLLHTERE